MIIIRHHLEIKSLHTKEVQQAFCSIYNFHIYFSGLTMVGLLRVVTCGLN